MFNIRFYTPTEQSEWDAFVQRSRNGVFLFQRKYMDYHADRFEDASIIVRATDSKAAILAVIPANRVRTPSGDLCISHGGLTFGGMVMAEKIGCAQVLAIFQALAEWLPHQGFTQLRYKAIPHIYHRLPSEDDLYALHRLGARVDQTLVSSTLDLGRAAPTSSQKNHALNLARRAGITVGTVHWSTYWPLLTETLRSRHSVNPVHSLSEIEYLAQNFPELEMIGAWQTQSTAMDQISEHRPPAEAPPVREQLPVTSSKIQAGVVLFHYAGVTHTQYLASSPAGFETRAQHAILEYCINMARARGQRWFSFGTSTEDGGRALNEGLLRHKEMFGARSTILQTLVLDLS